MPIMMTCCLCIWLYLIGCIVLEFYIFYNVLDYFRVLFISRKILKGFSLEKFKPLNIYNDKRQTISACKDSANEY